MSVATRGAIRARAKVRGTLVGAVAAGVWSVASSEAAARDRLLFPRTEDAKAEIVTAIRAETVRLDIATWYLTDREISIAIVERHNAGVPVRILGDRVSIFEIDAFTRREFEYLAARGVPIRLRYVPTSFPYIMHWKCGIFVGQNLVEFGSANWTPFELAPASSTNFKDETVMFTHDAALVASFRTEFDRMWADTTYFLDWPDAYRRETGQPWTSPMPISRVRLEPDFPSPDGVVWEQGPVLNNAITAAIARETRQVDVAVYRLSVPNITDALVRRLDAGVPVRVFVEPTQYRQIDWPEYWLTGARIDQLWVAGARIKERTHAGLTHMKVVITSASAMHGSSNFTKNWQRDHNYFIPAATKGAVYWRLRDEFDRMWDDTANYRDFYPRPPNPATQSAPGDGATAVSRLPRLEWKRAPWAVAFDVYLGTRPGSLTFQARVNAQLTEEPPLKYSWTPAQPLQPNTTYYWRVVARTFATAVDSSLVAWSVTRRFTTSGDGGGSTGPFGGTPAPLPGTVQAENFDEGGPATAYNDRTAGNAGGAYRATDVDLESTRDAGGGFNVGWMAPGEWLNYTVEVGTAGAYDVELRVAANGAGGTLHIEVNGADRTGPLVIPDTDGWQNWTTITRTGVQLTAGRQVWRLIVDGAGPGGIVGNVNFIRVTPRSSPTASPEIVIYAADVPSGSLRGNWSRVADQTAAAGIRVASANAGGPTVDAPMSNPVDYVDIPFEAEAGTRYRLWLRVDADADSKWNDSLWVQFSGAVDGARRPIYRIGTSSGLNVNMATCSTCVPSGWGWQNGAYWLPDTGEVSFAASGMQTMRIQIREDGVGFDQIVLSPDRYFAAPPGTPKDDDVIVTKP